MGIFDSALNGLFGLGGMFIQNRFNRNQNERQYEQEMALQYMNQAYNSKEAEKNRGFQAQQAEISRDWEEEMYNKYQSPSALMAQARDAGINPLAVFGNAQSGPGGVSTPSGSAASSSPGHAPQSPYMNGIALVESFAKMAGLLTEIENMDADTREKESRTQYQNILNAFAEDSESARVALLQKQGSLTDERIADVKAAIQVKYKTIEIGDSEILVNLSQHDLNVAAKTLKEMDAKQIETLTPILADYYAAQSDEARESAALNAARTVQVGVQTDRTEQGTTLDVVDTVTDVVGTGALILDGVAEFLGISETFERYKETRVNRGKNGEVRGSTTVTRSRDTGASHRKRKRKR